jgi:hypothetical protein
LDFPFKTIPVNAHAAETVAKAFPFHGNHGFQTENAIIARH